MSKLFGTDGIRGAVGQYPINKDGIAAFANALAAFFILKNQHPVVYIAGDTRQSTGWILSIVKTILERKGVQCNCVGILPTPVLAWIVEHHHADGGVMITASHNPHTDNGVKLFGRGGVKLSSEQQYQIANLLQNDCTLNHSINETRLEPHSESFQLYSDEISSLLKVVKPNIYVDGAHGAASHILHYIENQTDGGFKTIHCKPNGTNINAAVGALYPSKMAQTVQAFQHTIGVALDGDGDRAVFVDEDGTVLSAEHIAAFLILHDPTTEPVVVNRLCNRSFIELLQSVNRDYIEVDVGDCHIARVMNEKKIAFGFEPSGHFILNRCGLVSDGLFVALLVRSMLSQLNIPLKDIHNHYQAYPSISKNVPVKKKPPLSSLQDVQSCVNDWQQRIGQRGKCIVRYSGTEMFLRLYVESESEEQCHCIASEIEAAITRDIT
jgi:phosphoglucosamine mutase